MNTNFFPARGVAEGPCGTTGATPRSRDRVDRPPVLVVAEETVDGLGHDRTDPGDGFQFLDRRGPHALQVAKVEGEVPRDRGAHLGNAQRIEEAVQLGAAAAANALDQVGSGLGREAGQLNQSVGLQVEQLRQLAHQLPLDQQPRRFLAEHRDVERVARTEVPDPALELCRTAEAVGAGRVRTPLLHRRAAGGALDGHHESPSPLPPGLIHPLHDLWDHVSPPAGRARGHPHAHPCGALFPGCAGMRARSSRPPPGPAAATPPV